MLMYPNTNNNHNPGWYLISLTRVVQKHWHHCQNGCFTAFGWSYRISYLAVRMLNKKHLVRTEQYWLTGPTTSLFWVYCITHEDGPVVYCELPEMLPAMHKVRCSCWDPCASWSCMLHQFYSVITKIIINYLLSRKTAKAKYIHLQYVLYQDFYVLVYWPRLRNKFLFLSGRS
jgi:hypothetical protein